MKRFHTSISTLFILFVYASVVVEIAHSFAPANHHVIKKIRFPRSPHLIRLLETTTSDEAKDESFSNERRDVLKLLPKVLASTGAGVTAAAGATTQAAKAAVASSAAAAAAVVQPLVDLPMIRLRLPRGGLGRDYVAIPLKIRGQGPFEFMVDTGLTTEFITPHLQQTLGIQAGSDNVIQGIAAGGTRDQYLVELQGATIGENDLPLPTLHAVITDFPQEHIDPVHDPVEGMLGMEMLSLFDVDFDFKAGRIRFYPPGSVDQLLKQHKDLVEIPAVVINETGLIGIRLATPGATQPVLAFFDCGSTFSAMNWEAAKLLGLPDKRDPIYRGDVNIMAIGVDGRPMQLPTHPTQLTFLGEALQSSTGQLVGFAQPPASWKPWKPVQLAVGDIPAFQSVLGDGVRPYMGPAALVGLDVLSQRRIIFEAGDGKKDRRRRLLVGMS